VRIEADAKASKIDKIAAAKNKNVAKNAASNTDKSGAK